VGDIADDIIISGMMGDWGDEDWYGDDEDIGRCQVHVHIPVKSVAIEREKAWLIESNVLKKPAWFPKSQCQMEVNDIGQRTLIVPGWLAERKPEIIINLCLVL
jgi:hypothetical protein